MPCDSYLKHCNNCNRRNVNYFNCKKNLWKVFLIKWFTIIAKFNFYTFFTKNCFLIFKLPLKAIWRKVQELGLVRAYMSETEVRNFIKMLDALPFLPVDRIGMIICWYHPHVESLIFRRSVGLHERGYIHLQFTPCDTVPDDETPAAHLLWEDLAPRLFPTNYVESLQQSHSSHQQSSGRLQLQTEQACSNPSSQPKCSPPSRV